MVKIKNSLVVYYIIVTIFEIILNLPLGANYRFPGWVYISYVILGLPPLALAIYLGFKKETGHKVGAYIALAIAMLVVGFFIRTTISVLK